MRRPGPPRLNRFPQRLDYTLIPAPLDLTFPLVDEKANLPAIIVTPSSPIGEKDFSIAFLAPPPKPTFRQRVKSLLPPLPKLPHFQSHLPSQIQLPPSPRKSDLDTSSSWSVKARARTTILLAILLFIMSCHLIMHSMVAYHPRLDYGPLGSDESILTAVTTGNLDTLGGVQRNSADSTTPTVGGWFNLHSLWAPVPITDGKRSAHFIVSDEDFEDLGAA